MKKMMFALMAAGALSFTGSLGYAQQDAQVLSAPQEANIPAPPQFSSEEANKGLGEFVTLVREYAPAIQAQNAEKIQEFGAKINSWQQGVTEWVSKLSPEEQSEFQGYMQKLSMALQPTPSPAMSPVESPVASPVME